MGIIGLSTQTGALPRIGELRKGAPRDAAGAGVGQDLDHFRFTSVNPELVQRFLQVYGPEPRSIEVRLPYATVAANWDCWMKSYASGVLKRQCDGETCVQRLEMVRGVNTQMRNPVPCLCTSLGLPEKHPDRCEQSGKLTMLLPALGHMGAVTLTTGSFWDISGLSANLQWIMENVGTVRGIPLVLARREREISVPVGKGRQLKTSWLLALELAPRVVEQQIAALETRAFGPPIFETPRFALPDARATHDDEADTATSEARFWYNAEKLGILTWDAFESVLGSAVPVPTSADGWRIMGVTIEALAAQDTLAVAAPAE